MSDLTDFYSDIIMEHSAHSHNRHEMPDETCSAHGHNPNCGDDITLHIKYIDGKIADLSFTGDGCAISQSSTSVMIDLLKGKTKQETLALIDIFIDMIDRKPISKEQEKMLKEAMAFQNVQNMPARVKCALLAWKTLKQKIMEWISY